MTRLPQPALEYARSLFPYLADGRIYLNHAATSPLSTRVVNVLAAHLHDRMGGALETYETDVEMVKSWREVVQRLINAEATDRIAFLMNTSDALNVVASGLPWQAGDRILLNDAEFPANLHPFAHLRRHGVALDLLHVPDGAVTPELIADALTPRTRLLSLSAVQFLSGYRADLRAIGELCRSRDVVFVVDGIQAVGAVPLDVQALRIDALAAGGQKWQMAPQGTGFLYVTEALQERIRQQHVGWLSVASPWDFHLLDQPLARSGRRYEGGTLNIPGMYAMRESLLMLEEFGRNAVAGQILGTTALLMQELSAIPGVRVLTPADDAHRAGIVTIRPPAGMQPEEIAAQLKARGIAIAVREGCLRFSPHFYNSTEEMQRTAEEVRRIIGASIRAVSR